MRAKCPQCKTSYDLNPLVAKGANSVIICAVCYSHLEIKAPSWKSMFLPKVTIREKAE